MSRVAASLALGLALGASAAPNTIQAPTGADTLTVGLLGDYGWTGWTPAPLDFCNNVLPQLTADGAYIPRDVLNDCDPGDRQAISTASAEEGSTASYIGQVCQMKNCSAFMSVGDNFYDSGVDFTTTGLQRFYEGWKNLYTGAAFDNKPWYQALGNHDVVPGSAGVDFQTRIAPLIDNRWNFGDENSTYWSYDLTGSNWTAHFVVMESDCFINKYQSSSSVYYTPYLQQCHKETAKQVDFLRQSFAQSKADWKILQLHHGYISSSTNYTELAPLIDIARQHNGVVINGHDHCLAHYEYQDMNYVLTGGAGFAEAGDCNYGVPLGPYVKFLGANSQNASNGFVTMDISSHALNFEYWLRDFGGNNMKPGYSFNVTKHST